jgi:hypothetical protein
MVTMTDAFAAFCSEARVPPTIKGRPLTVLKAAFAMGLKLGTTIAQLPHEEAMAMLQAWGAEIDDFYKEGEQQ